MRIPGRCWIIRHRITNRWHDLRAVLAGYCNHRPWSPIPGDGGGYAHWRCALTRGHDGLHRARNYVWSDDGRTDYVPVPIDRPMPDQPWSRHMTPTRRQARAGRRWQAEQVAAMRARRAGA
jgi:hypothetical protein